MAYGLKACSCHPLNYLYIHVYDIQEIKTVSHNLLIFFHIAPRYAIITVLNLVFGNPLKSAGN